MVKYEAAWVDDLRQSIKDLAGKPQQSLTAREVVESMQEELRQKREEGWSFAELAQVLTEKGLRIATPTLRDYLGSAKKRRTRGQSSRPAGSKKGRERVAVEAAVKNPAVTAAGAPVKTSVAATPAGVQSRHAGFNEDN